MLLLLLFPFAFSIAAQQEQVNAGLVSGIWYSKLPFFAGETVRIYTAIQNNSGTDVKGKVQFLKNEELIEETPFSALRGGLVRVWADWKAQQGNYKILAKIVEATPPVSSSFAVAQSEVFVDQDTDKDQVGNIQDNDDDNDGLTDEKEAILGTDPLNPDTKKEPKAGEKIYSGLEEQIDSLVETVTEKLASYKEERTKQRKEPALPILAGTIQKIDDAIPILEIPKERMPTKEGVVDFLLAAAITALPHWRIGVLILGSILLFKLIRRFLF